MHLGLLYSFFLNSSKGQQLTHPLLMFRPVVKKKGEEEDSMMARRTRGTSGPAWGTPTRWHEGRQEDASLTACGPVSVAGGEAGFLLACGVGLSDTSHDHCLGGFVWCHVGPRGAHTHPSVYPYARPSACIGQPSSHAQDMETSHIRTWNFYYFPFLYIHKFISLFHQR